MRLPAVPTPTFSCYITRLRPDGRAPAEVRWEDFTRRDWRIFDGWQTLAAIADPLILAEIGSMLIWKRAAANEL